MIPKRYSWRIVALAAISLIGNVYLGYYMLFGLAPDGLGLDEHSGRVVVTDVGEHTAAARAGLQAGDQILSVNGQQIVLPEAPARWQAFFEGAFAHVEERRAETVAVFWQRLRECLESGGGR